MGCFFGLWNAVWFHISGISPACSQQRLGNFFGLTFFERRDVSLRVKGTELLLLPSCAFSLSRWLIIKEPNGGPVVQCRKVCERAKREGCAS